MKRCLSDKVLKRTRKNKKSHREHEWKNKIFLQCSYFCLQKFDFVDYIELCLQKINFKLTSDKEPSKQACWLYWKHNLLPPLDKVLFRSFGATRSSHSSVLISWSLNSWFKLSLGAVYFQNRKIQQKIYLVKERILQYL